MCTFVNLAKSVFQFNILILFIFIGSQIMSKYFLQSIDGN